MTPSTVEARFVSAILSAGFHVGLAGGEHCSPQFGFRPLLWQEGRKGCLSKVSALLLALQAPRSP